MVAAVAELTQEGLLALLEATVALPVVALAAVAMAEIMAQQVLVVQAVQAVAAKYAFTVGDTYDCAD